MNIADIASSPALFQNLTLEAKINLLKANIAKPVDFHIEDIEDIQITGFYTFAPNRNISSILGTDSSHSRVTYTVFYKNKSSYRFAITKEHQLHVN